LLSFAGADAAKRLTPPISLSAVASVAPTVQFLGDATGTVFTFTVRNTSTGPGALSIGAVEIARPSTAWTVVACPSAPAGWSTQRSDNFCRYRSESGTTDDIAPGESDSFQLRATTASGTQDRAGTWAVRASRSDSFSRSSMIGPLRGEPPGLTITAHSFEILDVVVGTGTIGAACPSATEGNHSAITGSSQTILICGRNRMTIAATPTAGSSSIGGEFIGAPGAFSSDSIPANSGNVILASWTGATITSTTGPDLAIQARIGSSSSRTSPLTQLDDDCSSAAGWCIDNGGYEALNQPPVAQDMSASTLEDQSSAPITLTASDGDGQPVSFAVTDPAHGTLDTLAPAATCDAGVPSTCTASVVYTPDPDYNGLDSFTFTATDPFAATSAPATVTITVTAVNDAPSFTKGADETVAEDAGAQTVSSWATAISAGPANESGQTVGFTLTGNTNPGLFSAGPVVSPTGTLTYTPAPNANGSTTVTLAIADNGGTANGGLDTSPTQQFTITVTAVNDAPSFTKGADQTVLEDAGAQSVSSWATAISAGPADEAGQAVSFTLTDNTNPSLFASGPAIAPDGTLTYTPAANANGSAIVTLKVVDDGAPPAESPTQQFTITVTAVNDAPGFDLPASPDQSVVQDSGAQSVTGFATSISAGPADESGQALTFTVTNGNNSLFSAQPDIDEVTGDLTYTSATGATGTATVSVSLSDDGGTADGGDDTSATQTFDITVVPPNATPVAQGQTGGSAVAATEDLVKTITLTATDADGDALTLSIVGNPTQGTLGNFSAVSCVGNPSTCTQTVDYTPFANQHGPDSFTFKANDGTIDSSTATVEIVVAAVNDPPSSPGRAFGASSLQAHMQRSIDAGDGLLVGAADAADIAGDAAYTPTLTIGVVDGVAPVGGTITAPVAGVGTVVANAATGAFTLDPAPGITGDVSFGYTVCDAGDGTPATECVNATASFNIAGPVIWFVDPAAVTNGSGTLASPFNVLASADAVDAANHRIFVYSGTTTTGLSLNSGEWLIGQAATGPFDALFAITPPAGTITRPTMGAGTATIGSTVTLASNAKVQGVAISAGASTGLNDPGGAINGVAVSETSITTTTGTGVSLSDIGGTVSITGLTTSGGAGASLTGANNGATFSFAGVSASSGANAAFTATGGGTVSVTGAANTLTTTTGTALNVANTTIGASGLTFRSIASNGAASGIVLNNTGSSGGLTVTGTGVAGSGGTIQSSSGPGVSLTSTRSVSLSSMTISNGLDDGIRGSSVTGLSIANSTVSNNGNAVTERGIEVINLVGTASITGSTLTSSAEDNLYILNDVATALSLTVSGGTISETDAVTGNDGILVIANGPSNVTASVTGVSFSNQRGDHIQFTTDAVSAATVNVTIDGNTLTSTNPALVLGGGITVNPSGTASVTAIIRNHATFTGAVTSAVSIASSQSSTVRATIANNAIGSVSVDGSGSSQGNGIYVSRTNTSSIFTAITNNQIQQWTNLSGIDLNAGDGTGGGLHATITGNTLSNPATGPFPLHGVHLNSGTTTGNDQVNCLDLRTNTLAGSGVAANGGFDVRVRQRFLTTIRLPGYAGPNNDNAAVAAFVQANNTGSPTVSASNNVAGGGGGFVNAACTLP
jgi:hypothetical protein